MLFENKVVDLGIEGIFPCVLEKNQERFRLTAHDSEFCFRRDYRRDFRSDPSFKCLEFALP